MNSINNNLPKCVAILVENNFEDSEFQIPYKALRQVGISTIVVGSRMNDEYQGKQGKVAIKPDATATEVRAEDFDAIVIPGGNAPDLIRTNPNAVRLVVDGMSKDKLIAAICHGPQVLIEADGLRERRVTGFRSIRKDIQNAGALYFNQPIVKDGNLITARQPSDLPIFTAFLLCCLGRTIEDIPSIEVNPYLDRNSPTVTDFDWWKFAQNWGGSSRNEIIDAINQAIIGERYTQEAFRQYEQRVLDPELKLLFQEVINTKQYNLQLLENRLKEFDEQLPWQIVAGETFAVLQSWTQSQDAWEVVRRALGDLQTGVVDSYHLCVSITDPVTSQIFETVEANLANHEQCLAEFYRGRMGSKVKSPTPTTTSY